MSELDDALAEGHEHQEKHLQLGTDLNNDDRTPLTDDEKDALWGTARTVELFEAELQELEGEDPEVLEALRVAREAKPNG